MSDCRDQHRETGGLALDVRRCHAGIRAQTTNVGLGPLDQRPVGEVFEPDAKRIARTDVREHQPASSFQEGAMRDGQRADGEAIGQIVEQAAGEHEIEGT